MPKNIINRIKGDINTFETYTIKGEDRNNPLKEKEDYILIKIRTYIKITSDNKKELERNFKRTILMNYEWLGFDGHILEEVDDPQIKFDIKVPEEVMEAIVNSNAYDSIEQYIISKTHN